MQLMHPTTAVSSPSTLVTGTPAVSCPERLELLQAAIEDRTVPRHDTMVLSRILRYVNAELGVAWPSQQRIADDLGMVRQNVNRSLKRLEARGYLVRVLVRLQPDDVPRTAWCPSAPASTPDAQDVTPRGYIGEPVEVTACNPQGLQRVTPRGSQNPVKGNPVNEPGEESPTGIPGGSPGGTGERPPARSERQVARPQVPQLGYLPDDWQPSERLIARAMAELQLTREQVARETVQFRSHQRSRPKQSADWSEDWWRFLENVRPGARWRAQFLGEGERVPTYAEQRALRDNVGRLELATAQARGGYR